MIYVQAQTSTVAGQTATSATLILTDLYDTETPVVMAETALGSGIWQGSRELTPMTLADGTYKKSVVDPLLDGIYVIATDGINDSWDYTGGENYDVNYAATFTIDNTAPVFNGEGVVADATVYRNEFAKAITEIILTADLDGADYAVTADFSTVDAAGAPNNAVVMTYNAVTELYEVTYAMSTYTIASIGDAQDLAITVTATDLAGNVSTDFTTVDIDNVAPVYSNLNLNLPVDGETSIVDGIVNFTFDVAETHVDEKPEVKFVYENGVEYMVPAENIELTGATYEVTVDFDILDASQKVAGYVDIVVNGQDIVGNTAVEFSTEDVFRLLPGSVYATAYNLVGSQRLYIKAESDPKAVLGIEARAENGDNLVSVQVQINGLLGWDETDLKALSADATLSGLALYKDSNDPDGVAGTFDQATDIPLNLASKPNWIGSTVTLTLATPDLIPVNNTDDAYAGNDYFVVIRTGMSKNDGGTLEDNDEFRVLIPQDGFVFASESVTEVILPATEKETDSIVADVTAPSAPVVSLLGVTMNVLGEYDLLSVANNATEPSAIVKVYRSEDDAVAHQNHIAKSTTNAYGGLSNNLKIGTGLDNEGELFPNADENNLIYVTATDVAGNEGEYVTLTNDVTAPVIAGITVTTETVEDWTSALAAHDSVTVEIAVVEAGTFTAEDLTVTVQAPVVKSGDKAPALPINLENAVLVSGIGTVEEPYVYRYTFMVDGTWEDYGYNFYKVAANAVDYLDNPIEAINEEGFKVDNTAPVFTDLAAVTTSAIEGKVTVGDVITVTFNFTDAANLGVTTPVVELTTVGEDSTAVVEMTQVSVDAGLYTYEYTIGENPVNGSMSLVVSNLADFLGNVIDPETDVDLTVEEMGVYVSSGAPVVTITAVAGGVDSLWFANGDEVALTVDSEPGLEWIVTWENIDTNAYSDGLFTHTISADNEFVDGEYMVKVTGTNEFGVSDSDSTYITLDNTAPVFTADSENPVAETVLYPENVQGYSVSVDYVESWYRCCC